MSFDEYLKNNFTKLNKQVLNKRINLISYRYILLSNISYDWNKISLEEIKSIQDNLNNSKEELWRYGLIYKQGGKFKICLLYEELFNLDWVEKKLISESLKKVIKELVGNNKELCDTIREIALWRTEEISPKDELIWIKLLIEQRVIKNWEKDDKLQYLPLRKIRNSLREERKILIIYDELIKARYNISQLNKSDKEYVKKLEKLKIGSIQNQEFFIPDLYKCIFTKEWVLNQLLPAQMVREIHNYTDYNDNLYSMLEELALTYEVSYQSGKEREWVETLIDEQVVQKWKEGNKKIHKHLQEKNKYFVVCAKNDIEVLNLYENLLLENQEILADNSDVQNNLIELKIIKKNNNDILILSNELYGIIFNQNWITYTKNSLTPWHNKIINSINDFINTLKEKLEICIRAILRTYRTTIQYIVLGLIALFVVIVIGLFNNNFTLDAKALDAQADNAWEEFKINQLSGLHKAVKVVNKLRSIPWMNKNSNFEKYPTVKPLLNLQKMMRDIYEWNQITQEKTHAPVQVVAFNPVNNQFLIGSQDGKLSLYNESGTFIKNISNSSGAITSISYNKQGTLVAVASEKNNGTIQLFNTIKYIPQDSKNHVSTIKSMEFSPDGKYLLTGNKNGKAQLWKITPDGNSGKYNLEKTSNFINHGNYNGNYINSVKFHPDGKIFATAGEIGKSGNNEEVKFWNLAGKEQLPSIKTELTKIESISFSPNKESIAIAGDDQICLWNIQNLTKPLKLECEKVLGITYVSFSPQKDEKILIATGSESGEIDIWDDSLKQQAKLNQHYQDSSHKGVLSLDFSDNGEHLILISSGNDKTIRLWNLSKLWEPEYPITIVERDKSKIKTMDIGVIRDQKLRVVLLKEDKKGEIWEVSGQNQYPRDDADFKKVILMELIPKTDPSEVVFIQTDGSGKFYYLDKSEIPHKTINESNYEKIDVENLSITSNKNYIVIADKKGNIYMWDTQGNIYLHKRQITEGQIKSMSLSSDGKYFATVEKNNNQAQLWDISEKDKIKKIPWSQLPNNSSLIQINPNPNNSNLVITGIDGNVSLWNLKGELLDQKDPSIQGHSSEIKGLQFSDSGDYLITLDQDKKAIIWKIDNDHITKINEENDVLNISLSPNYDVGVLVALVKQDESEAKIFLLDMKGREIAELSTNMNNITHLQFSPDRKTYENYLIAADDQGTVKAWEIKNRDKLMKESCEWLKKAYLARNEKCEN